MAFNKPCLDCGQLTRTTRCTSCTTKHQNKRTQGVAGETYRGRKAHLYGGDYKQRAKLVRQTAIICHICGQGAGVGGAMAWEADHLYPELGHHSPLLPAHRKCNQQRGNKPLT